MFNIFKQPIVFMMKYFDIYSLFLLRADSALRDAGWFRSFREGSSVNLYGEPIPWITYSALDFIQKRINSEMDVFEYGCGMSTYWWAAKVKSVDSCEHDLQWYDKISKCIPSNVNLHYIQLEYGGDYSKCIANTEKKYDIIIIDGRDRVNCAINAIIALKDNGVILWDNSDRDEYNKGYEYLHSNGFKKIEFSGSSPIVTCKTETAIFYRAYNCLNI